MAQQTTTSRSSTSATTPEGQHIQTQYITSQSSSPLVPLPLSGVEHRTFVLSQGPGGVKEKPYSRNSERSTKTKSNISSVNKFGNQVDRTRDSETNSFVANRDNERAYTMEKTITIKTAERPEVLEQWKRETDEQNQPST